MTKVLLGDKLGMPHSESLDVNGFPDSIWKTIPDFPKNGGDSEYYRFEGRFQCDQYGNIRRFKKNTNGKLTKELVRTYWSDFTTKGKTYGRVNIATKNTIHHIFVHTIVLYTFGVFPMDKNLVCDHINGNSLDNRLENLRWVTQKENSNNHTPASYKKLCEGGKKGGAIAGAKNGRNNGIKSRSSAIVVRKYGTNEPWNYYYSIAEAARKLNISNSIGKACRGICKQIRGYEAKYYSELTDDEKEKVIINED